MSLADDMDGLDAYPKAEEPEYQPRTEFDGSSGFIQTGPLKEQPKDFTELLVQFGYDPEQVRIVGHPRTSRWQQRSQKRNQHGQRTGEYETVWLCAYRFHLAPVTGGGQPIDFEALVKNRRPVKATKVDESAQWFVFQAGDLQLGKRSRDGSTEQIVERYIQSVEAAKAELKSLKRLGIAGVQISMPGDCVEGVTSQKSANIWLTQETITEQTRILRRLMLFTIDELSPGLNKLYLDVVGGNHDDSQRHQNTYPGDNWATESAIAVHDAMKLNPAAYGHVEVRVPDKWSGMMTVPVGDTPVCVIHGHQWKQENNAWRWWADQAVNHLPAGGALVMQSGHFHSWRVTSNEHKTHIQSPTLDCGSDWYRNVRGGTNRRGALAYLLKTGEVSRMSVL